MDAPVLATPNPALVVRETPHRGRGVFAVMPIAEGTLVESCPVLEVPVEDAPRLLETVLGDYLFLWGGTRDRAALALGYGSLYNHSDAPNAMYVRKPSTLDFVALRDIAAGEEITVSYNGGFGDTSPVWFEAR
jgi:SET domain-containing protein